MGQSSPTNSGSITNKASWAFRIEKGKHTYVYSIHIVSKQYLAIVQENLPCYRCHPTCFPMFSSHPGLSGSSPSPSPHPPRHGTWRFRASPPSRPHARLPDPFAPTQLCSRYCWPPWAPDSWDQTCADPPGSCCGPKRLYVIYIYMYLHIFIGYHRCVCIYIYIDDVMYMYIYIMFLRYIIYHWVFVSLYA